MTPPLLTELPYQPDSAALFEAIADAPWAVFLDSGRHDAGQSRYDILSAQPYMRLVTRGNLTATAPLTDNEQWTEMRPGELLVFEGGAPVMSA